MATIKKVKKAKMGTTSSQTTKKPLSDKDSINIYANRYDKFSASAAGKLGAGKNASKDLKSMKEARANENRLSKKVYGTTPSQKMGGKVKKAKDGIVKRISDTKLKDVPGKVMNAGRRLVDKVKNSTVGDVASAATMGLPGTMKSLSNLSKKSSSITKNLKGPAYKMGGMMKKGGKMSKGKKC
jgi:hypothetical protein